MGIYYSKSNLYREIANFKTFLGLEKNEYGIDLIDLCIKSGTIIKFLPFKTQGLRGMCIIGDEEQEDVILLNENRNKYEQNFDCGHETIHLALHRNEGFETFNCFEKVKDTQNHFLEWQANEGAAELFIPYKIFLPIVKEKIGFSTDHSVIESAKTEMAQIFHVPDAVIKYRLENLKYEIFQYLNGVKLDYIEILSLHQQKQRGIKVDSLNTVSDIDFTKRLYTWHNKLSYK